ncbi:MAG: hypothetical protein GY915_01520 [bacterium]|nr:hypothetical protein [bacterium]
MKIGTNLYFMMRLLIYALVSMALFTMPFAVFASEKIEEFGDLSPVTSFPEHLMVIKENFPARPSPGGNLLSFAAAREYIDNIILLQKSPTHEEYSRVQKEVFGEKGSRTYAGAYITPSEAREAFSGYIREECGENEELSIESLLNTIFTKKYFGLRDKPTTKKSLKHLFDTEFHGGGIHLAFHRMKEALESGFEYISAEQCVANFHPTLCLSDASLVGTHYFRCSGPYPEIEGSVSKELFQGTKLFCQVPEDDPKIRTPL